jgi:hypothetical protein
MWRYNELNWAPGCLMKPQGCTVLLLFALASVAFASSDTPKAPAAPRMSQQTRMDLIRAFNAELVYVRSPFPMGRKGLTLKNGVISPNAAELNQMMAMWGPAAKPGDQARISDIVIKDDRIHFEINGGPVKRQKWYQRISVGGTAGTAPIAPSDSNANPRGSYVDLIFEHYVPELSPQELKSLLQPVFDFDSKSGVEAYLETVPPKVKEAIKNHQVLVGMNREMVMYSKGRPPRKIREKDGEIEYEEWIYGEPPQDVDFVRLVGDEVIRVEVMKVGGEKILRTEKEVDLSPQTSVAAQQTAAEPRPANAPSLRRAGEDLPNDSPKQVKVPIALPGSSPSSSPDPGGGDSPHWVGQLLADRHPQPSR